MKKSYNAPVANITYFYTESLMTELWSGEHVIDLPEDEFSNSGNSGNTEP